jgi:cyclopropane-fatty-acyl-phospholipid synthase
MGAMKAGELAIAGEEPDLRATPGAFRTIIAVARANWQAGALTFVLPDDREIRIVGNEAGPHGRLIVRDFGFARRVLASADIGFGEGFMAGEWDTPDLSQLLEAFSVNFDRLERLVTGHPLLGALNGLANVLRGNSRRGARHNIHAHYDLGNAFYARWLDAGMTYSAARFERPGESLAQAQHNKYARLARDIAITPRSHVLEIGCGWGGFAEFVTREIGARVTAITISRAQFEFARKRLFDQGLSDRADVQLTDYRDVEGQFDQVASIEMFEAVGESYWPAYFRKVRDVLAPGGRAGLQIITIRDELFAGYRRRSDFLRKYIFPGGMLPSEGRLREETQKAGLEWKSVARFGLNYAETLAEWARRFEGGWEEIRSLGFDERFRRLWRFYLSYCEAGFRAARTDVVQVGLVRV